MIERINIASNDFNELKAILDEIDPIRTKNLQLYKQLKDEIEFKMTKLRDKLTKQPSMAELLSREGPKFKKVDRTEKPQTPAQQQSRKIITPGNKDIPGNRPFANIN